MARYRIAFTLRESCPFDLTQCYISVNDEVYIMDYYASHRALSLGEIEASDHQLAARHARDVVNRFLNYLFVLSKFPGELEAYYKYENLDSANDKGQVHQIETAVDYSFQGQFPDKLDLPTDCRGAAFMRRGDLTRDPFDRYRNYYLAVDCIGKSLKQTKDSRVIAETLSKVTTTAVIDFLNQCLSEVSVPNSVNRYEDPIEDINAVLYHGFRCALMHSGACTDFTPFDAEDEERVVSALRVMRGVAWKYVKFYCSTNGAV